MKIQRVINNLGLALLFTVLTAYSPVAPARLLDCISKLLGAPVALRIETSATAPHAIAYDEIKAQSYTAHSDQFMQVMWKTFLTGSEDDILSVESDFFTNFIREHQPKLEAVHRQNRIYADEDSANVNLLTKEAIQRRFAIMDEYLAHLRSELQKGTHFSYGHMLSFAQIFTSAHEIQAHKKLEALWKSNDSEALQARYPGFGFEDLRRRLDAVDARGSDSNRLRYWESHYAAEAKLPAGARRFISTGHLTGRLLLPTPYPCGSFAFFATFHLPVNPIFMATEFELQDANFLISPVQNFTHDHTHFQTAQSYYASDLKNPKIVESLRKDLDTIRARFKAENDPELLKVMYYLFYYNKFENTSRFIPVDIPLIITAFKSDFSSAYDTVGNIYSLFESLRRTGSSAAPVKSHIEFLRKISKVIYILSDLELQKKWGTGFIYQLNHKTIKNEFEQRMQKIESRFSNSN